MSSLWIFPGSTNNASHQQWPLGRGRKARLGEPNIFASPVLRKSLKFTYSYICNQLVTASAAIQLSENS